ncbi:MAG: hypothetical protein DDT18_01799 [Actinobacteria bacterium]|nr:hypothetical protein [Actinomycetota bacterium]
MDHGGVTSHKGTVDVSAVYARLFGSLVNKIVEGIHNQLLQETESIPF